MTALGSAISYLIINHLTQIVRTNNNKHNLILPLTQIIQDLLTEINLTIISYYYIYFFVFTSFCTVLTGKCRMEQLVLCYDIESAKLSTAKFARRLKDRSNLVSVSLNYATYPVCQPLQMHTKLYLKHHIVINNPSGKARFSK